MGLSVKRRLRIRGFSSEPTSIVREEMEPVKAAAIKAAEKPKLQVKRDKLLSRYERSRLKTALLRANLHHRRLLRGLRAKMSEI
ncbi:MAG: hypothetical protein QXO86_03295 [Nitrososphaerota archaeon]